MILDTCTDCSRPYDVAHLAVGTPVRCLCGTVFSVKHRDKGVTPMWCRRCGGAVREDDRACPYCEAAIGEEERSSIVCPLCLARAPRDARFCPGCGGDLVPQALTPLPGDRDCPRCGDALRLRCLGITSVVECSGCEGLWLGKQQFEGVLKNARRAADEAGGTGSGTVGLDGPRGPLPETLPAGSRAYLKCFECPEMMLRRQVRWDGSASGVVVDVCARHGLWLDRDELEHVVQHLLDSGGGHRPGFEELFPRSLVQRGGASGGPRPVRSRRRYRPKGSHGGGVFEGEPVVDLLRGLLWLVHQFLR